MAVILNDGKTQVPDESASVPEGVGPGAGISPVAGLPGEMGEPGVAAPSFLRHAKLIGVLTLVSRLFGLARDMASAHYLGHWHGRQRAFRLAFTIPNLFRKLFGEGALAVAFIPLYAQSLKNESAQQADRFAAATVTLLVLILTALTIVGELIILGLAWTPLGARPDMMQTLKLTAIMLPYVLLICGTAFLGAILQVHKRFGMLSAVR